MIKVEKLNPFGRMCVSLGMLPSSYKESLTYEEQLIWFCNYLTETVIPTVNNNAEAVEELQALYTQIKTYVDEYFDNLDVTEEINNKLDEMVENGYFNEIIENYIAPEFDNQNEEINNFKTEVNNQIVGMNNRINNLSSGTPLVVSSTDEMTNTGRIYVLTTDGHWYYYDDAWVDGGLYQSTGIENKSITGIKTNFLESNNKLKFDDVESTTENGITYSVSNGIINVSGTSTSAFYINLPVKNNEILTGLYCMNLFTDRTNDVNYILNYEGNYTEYQRNISDKQIYNFNNSSLTRFRIRIASNVTINKSLYPMLFKDNEYDIINNIITFNEYNDTLSNNEKIKNLKGVLINEENTSFMRQSLNLVDPRKLIDGYAHAVQNGVLRFTEGNYKTAIIYNNSNESKNYIVYPKMRSYGILDFSTNSFTANTTATTLPSVISVPAYSRLNITFYNSDSPFFMCLEGNDTTGLKFIPFEYTIPYLKYESDKNILYNKKYVTMGDSFTHGDFTNSPLNDYYITNGKYVGQYKVYPYIIGNRNNMNIINLSQNGMTLARRQGSTNSIIQSEVYKNLPLDTDYITIKIGINDDASHQNIPLGTIDSDDDSTFYGAYNEVLTYLITNYPDAKIGLIATNGSTIDIVNATINIGNKYGLPVLNESTDSNVPLLIRTNRNNVPESIKNIRNNNWFVSTTIGSENSHPNAKCHEYESTIIENFLKTL